MRGILRKKGLCISAQPLLNKSPLGVVKSVHAGKTQEQKGIFHGFYIPLLTFEAFKTIMEDKGE